MSLPRSLFATFLVLLAGLHAVPAPAQAPQAPPLAPESAAPAPPVAPPLPGELTAAPATPPPPATPLPSRIPDFPVPQGGVVPSTPLATGQTTKSISTSGQFIVHGSELTLRSAFSTRCEEVSEELRTLLRDTQNWVLPVVVSLTTGEAARKAAKPVEMVVSFITSGGFHLQVNVNVRPDLRPGELRAELVRVLLVERILRKHKEITTKRPLILPDWLFTGVMEALDFRQRARPSALFAAIFKSGRIFGIEEIIEASADSIDDALSKTIYQTSCCALVLALLDQPEGGMRLTKFFDSLAVDARPEREILNGCFPGFASSPASLNKWWSLQLASLSSPGMSEPLSPRDTLLRLEEALTLRYQAKRSEIPRSAPMFASLIKAATPPPPAPVESFSMTQPKSLDAAIVKVKAPAQLPSRSSSSSSTVQTTFPDVPEEAEAPKKRSFLEWVNPFGRRSSDDEINEAIAQAEADEARARKVAEIAESPPEGESAGAIAAAAEPRKPKPLFDRWFGKDPEPVVSGEPEKLPEPKKAVSTPPPAKKATPTKKAAPKSEKKAAPAAEESPKKAEAPKPEPPMAEEPPKKEEPPKAEEPAMEEAPKKPSGGLFNRLFRSRKDKKPEEGSGSDGEGGDQEAPASPAGKDGASVQPQPALRQVLWAWAPLTADLYAASVQAWLPESPRSRQVEGFLGLKFGKKKKTEGEAPKEEPPKEEKKPEPKAEPKAAPKPDKPAKEEPRKAEAAPAPAADKEDAPKGDEIKPIMVGEPAAEDTAAEAAKPKREPVRIRPLFGSGRKNPKPEPAPEEPLPPLDTIPKAEMAVEPKADAPAAEPARSPEPEKEMEAAVAKKAEPKPQKPSSSSKKAVTKKAPPPPEPLIEAAVSIENYSAIMKRPDRMEILKHNVNALGALQNRAAVLFRPIVEDYSILTVELAEGKAKDVDARLRSLRARCQKALEQSRAVRDFLDLHEANESQAASGLFEDYLKLPETLQKEIPARADPISRYLDALDREFARE